MEANPRAWIERPSRPVSPSGPAGWPGIREKLIGSTQTRRRPAERFFGASRWPGRPAQCSQSAQTFAAGPSKSPSGFRSGPDVSWLSLNRERNGAAIHWSMALRSLKPLWNHVTVFSWSSELTHREPERFFGAVKVRTGEALMSSAGPEVSRAVGS